MCFVFIWEQTANCATYSINWLVFITEMKSVYSAVRTGALNKAVCASYVKVEVWYISSSDTHLYCRNIPSDVRMLSDAVQSSKIDYTWLICWYCIQKGSKTELDAYVHIKQYSISTFCFATTMKGNSSINIAVYCCNESYSSNICTISQIKKTLWLAHCNIMCDIFVTCRISANVLL